MKTAKIKMKKKVSVVFTSKLNEVQVKFPKQLLGCVSISFKTSSGEMKQLKCFELWIMGNGDQIKCEAI